MRPNALPRLHQKILVFILTSATLDSICLAAESDDLIQLISPEIKSQLWINLGMISYHFQQDKNFNNGNWCAGLEYRFNTAASLTAGCFYNSDRQYSNYAGVYYQPLAIGPIKVGVVIGGFNGYPQTNDGDWFAAALTALTWEGEWVGANIFVIPAIGDRMHAAISLQLKLKIFEQDEKKQSPLLLARGLYL